jgi:hypothetical protein
VLLPSRWAASAVCDDGGGPPSSRSAESSLGLLRVDAALHRARGRVDVIIHFDNSVTVTLIHEN